MIDPEYEPMASELEEAFTRAVRGLMRDAHVIDGVVKSVDYPGAYTCTVTVGDDATQADFGGVTLRVLNTSKGAYVEIPMVGTQCIILFRDGHQGRPQLFACHQADKVLLTSNLIEVNGGGNGGVINIEQAITEWQGIKDDVNRLKTVFAGWIPSPGDGGAALKTAATSWAGNELPAVNRQALEDTKFTH